MTSINNSYTNPYYSNSRFMVGLTPEESEKILEEQEKILSAPTPTPAPTSGGASAPVVTPSDTTPAPPANPNVPTPTYEDSFAKLLPSNGDGAVTITLSDGTEFQFEYPSFEDYFNNVVLNAFIRRTELVKIWGEGERRNPSYSDKTSRFNYDYTDGYPPADHVTLDKDNNVVITDEDVTNLYKYIDMLARYDMYNNADAKCYAQMLNISEEEARNFTPEMAKEKLNEFYKKIGNGEKDENGNYKVSIATYYTHISENYLAKGYRLKGLAEPDRDYVYMLSPEDLTEDYVKYCAQEFNVQFKKQVENQYVKDIGSEIFSAYRELGHTSQSYSHCWDTDFPDVILYMAKDGDADQKKVANMIFKAAGISEDDKDYMVTHKLKSFVRKLALDKDNTMGYKVEPSVIQAYLNANGFNDPSLYPVEEPQVEEIPSGEEEAIPKVENTSTEFDYSDINGLNEKVFDRINFPYDWSLTYDKISVTKDNMHDYVKKSLEKLGKTYDEKTVERYLNYFITQVVEEATDSTKGYPGEKKTLKDAIESIKQLVDDELIKEDAFTIQTAEDLKELLLNTNKNLLEYKAAPYQRELTDDFYLRRSITSVVKPDDKTGDLHAKQDAVSEIEIYSEYQALELKDLYPQLTSAQIEQILVSAKDFSAEQFDKLIYGKSSVSVRLLVTEFRDFCLREAQVLLDSQSQEPLVTENPTTNDDPDLGNPFVSIAIPMPPTTPEISVETIQGEVDWDDSETDSEPEIPSWQVPMINAAKEKGYQATDITGKYTYTDESGTSYICVWDSIGQYFMNFVVSTPEPEVEPEFSEDDTTLVPTVDGYYAEAQIAATKEGYERGSEHGLFEKDGKEYEYDVETKEFVEYNPLELTLDSDNHAIKKTLRNIYMEALHKAYELGYRQTNRIGIYEKDGKQYKYDADAHKFVEIKSKTPEPQPEPESEEE